MVEQKHTRKREQSSKQKLFDTAARRMPTQTRAQSNQAKTVIEVLACAQTQNKLRPRQGKRLTDQVNLQSPDRSVFECFLTLSHWQGEAVFLSAVSWLTKTQTLWKWRVRRVSLGKSKKKQKANVIQGTRGCWGRSDLISETQVSQLNRANGLGWKLSFVSPQHALIPLQIFKLIYTD